MCARVSLHAHPEFLDTSFGHYQFECKKNAITVKIIFALKMVENDCLLPSFLFYFLNRADIDCECVLCMAVAIGQRSVFVPPSAAKLSLAK